MASRLNKRRRKRDDESPKWSDYNPFDANNIGKPRTAQRSGGRGSNSGRFEVLMVAPDALAIPNREGGQSFSILNDSLKFQWVEHELVWEGPSDGEGYLTDAVGEMPGGSFFEVCRPRHFACKRTDGKPINAKAEGKVAFIDSKTDEKFLEYFDRAEDGGDGWRIYRWRKLGEGPDGVERVRTEKAAAVIAVYNYKGGVGKTTTCCNLAVTMANMGYKTLVVDFDGQCNTTKYFNSTLVDSKPPRLENPASIGTTSRGTLNSASEDEKKRRKMKKKLSSEFKLVGDKKSKKAQKPEETNTIEFNAEHEAQGFKTIRHLIQEPLKLAGTAKDKWKNGPEDDYSFIREKVLLPVQDPQYSRIQRKGVDDPDGDPLLYRLLGDSTINELEKGLQYGVTDDPSSLLNWLAFRIVVKKLDELEGFDFVVVDLPPADSKLVQCIVSSADYILPPSFAEPHSCQAVYQLLNELLPKWIDDFRTTFLIRKSRLLKTIDKLKRHKPKDVVERYVKLPSMFPWILPIMLTNYKTQSDPDSSTVSDDNLVIEASASNWRACLVRMVQEVCSSTEESLMKVREQLLVGDSVETAELAVHNFIKHMDGMGQLNEVELGFDEQCPAIIYNFFTENTTCFGMSREDFENSNKYARERYRNLVCWIVEAVQQNYNIPPAHESDD